MRLFENLISLELIPRSLLRGNLYQSGHAICSERLVGEIIA